MTTTPPEADHQAQELLRDLVAQGWRKRGIARAIDRHPRYIDFVLAGTKPGRNLVPALQELSSSGTVRTPPARRRRADGQVARIRGRRGQPSRTPTIPVPAPPVEDAVELEDRRPPRSLSTSTEQPEFTAEAPQGLRNRVRRRDQIFHGGRRSRSLRFPKRNRLERQVAQDDVRDLIGQAGQNRQRCQIVAWYELPDRQRKRVTLGGHGGYNAADIDQAIRDGDVFDWLIQQRGERGNTSDSGSLSDAELQEATLVGIDVDVW